MNGRLHILSIFLLLQGSYAQAMFFTAQKAPLGKYLFTGERLPCYVYFTRINKVINEEQEKQLEKEKKTTLLTTTTHTEVDTPISPQASRVNSNKPRMVEGKLLYHFYLGMKLIEGKAFTVPSTAQSTGFNSLLLLLFPGNVKDLFLFNSQKLNEYKKAINDIPDDQLLEQSKLQRGSFTFSKQKHAATIKQELIKDLDDFVVKINQLITIEHYSEPVFLWQKIISNLSITDTNLQSANKKKKILEEEKKLENALFGSSFQTIFDTGFSTDEKNNIQTNINILLTAHMSYLVDLSQANLTTMLPRALYRAVDELGKKFGVKAPTFDPWIHRPHSWLKTGMGMGVFAALFFAGKYSQGVQQ